MTFKRTLVAFLFLFIVTFMIACTGKNTEKPLIKFDTDSYGFGTVTEGSDVKHTFTFSNPGTKILIIKNFILSCQCVHIEERDRVVKPQGHGKITVLIKTNGLDGDITNTITVKTNIPDYEKVLTISGKVAANRKITNTFQTLPRFADIH
jgi:hypothetical protein